MLAGVWKPKNIKDFEIFYDVVDKKLPVLFFTCRL